MHFKRVLIGCLACYGIGFVFFGMSFIAENLNSNRTPLVGLSGLLLATAIAGAIGAVLIGAVVMLLAAFLAWLGVRVHYLWAPVAAASATSGILLQDYTVMALAIWLGVSWVLGGTFWIAAFGFQKHVWFSFEKDEG